MPYGGFGRHKAFLIVVYFLIFEKNQKTDTSIPKDRARD